MGRPTDCTPEFIDAVCAEIRKNGTPLNIAAEALGVSRTTIYQWRTRGAAGEEPFRTFRNAIEAAIPEGRRALLEEIRQAGKGGAKRVRVTVKKEVKRGPDKRPVLGPDGKPEMIEVERTEVVETLEPQWAANAWIAERTCPEEFGRRERIEHSGPDGGPIETKTRIDLSGLSEQELDILERLAARSHRDP
ncbi:MAG TPA: hypothetical protein VEI97_14600 [bacterium]|nr:hypothetical protein [bacterium]